MDTLQKLRAGALAGTTELRIQADLEEFPPEILDLSDTLEILDLSGNHLHELPDDFSRLRKLRIVFFSQNRFQEFPRVLAQCPDLEMVGLKSCRIGSVQDDALPANLRWLILTDNQLERLPDSIGDRPRLQKLMLAGNQLRELPRTLSRCRNLELLRVSANQLEAFPEWLLDMPRLSWLAWSGNPFCARHEERELPPEIDWSELQVESLLGSGASGIISRAHVRGTSRTVAVKVFKGSVTSDGYPEDEMAASIAAGQHAELVGVQARIANHPEGRHGLVLSLIPPGYRNLGNPPSYESCTRDVFPMGSKLPADQIQSIARGIAALMAHLHDRGVNHGDLYAHNILIDPAGHPLKGDFGAASLLDGFARDRRESIQRLEVRAYGCLLDDLLGLAPTTDTATLAPVRSLRDACMTETVRARPLFEEIAKELGAD